METVGSNVKKYSLSQLILVWNLVLKNKYYWIILEPPFDAIGSEDCLYINVYTNAIGHKRPVMFYIYGGAFLEGNGNDLYKEDYFVSMDVVLVFVNYRLGPLGNENI